MMGKYEFISSFCLSQKGTVEDYKEEWQATRYLVGGKMYAMRGGDREGNPIVTLKLPPEEGLALRDVYAGDIVPGYYMNKEHWNSVSFSGNVPDDVLKQMLQTAYKTVLSSLSKKIQTEITGKEENQ